MVKMEKSQSALEMLTVYGWAFLVIGIALSLIFVIALAKSPRTYLSSSCEFQPALPCSQPLLAQHSPTVPITYAVSFVNDLGVPISLSKGFLTPTNSINLSVANVGSIGQHNYTGQCFPWYLPSGSQATCIVYIPTPLEPGIGSTVYDSFTITYSICSSQSNPGSCKGAYKSTGTSTQTIVGAGSNPFQSSFNYMPVNITNPNPTLSTPSPFQQMVAFDPSAYKTYESPNLQNIFFFYANGTIIPSWLEDNNSYTSTNSLYWIKLPAITPGNTMTVYMGFAPKGINVLNSASTGEAPQLPCGSIPTSACSSYAEYDDGVSVFNNYWNFAGKTLPNGLVSATFGDGISIDNGLTFLYKNYTSSYAYVATNIIPQPSIIEAYTPTIATPYSPRLGWSTTTSRGYQNTLYNSYENNFYNNGAPTPLNGAYASNSNDGDNYVAVTPSTTVNFGGIFSFAWLGSGSQWYAYNYQTGTSSNSNVTAPSYSNFYGFLGIFDGGDPDTNNPEFQWLRIRAYPPAGVMPSVTFGTVK